MRRPYWFDELGIPADYGIEPPRPAYADAEKLEEAGPNIIGRMQRLWPRTARDWRAMRKAAAGEGVQLLLVSGFRSVDDQINLIRAKLKRGRSIAEILEVNAAPGFSQHHTGKAVDIATPGCRPLIEAFEHTDAFEWLRQHAARFGFRMPYGRGNRYGFVYEPWHWSQLETESSGIEPKGSADAAG